MKALYIIALCLHLLEDKRIDSKIDIKPFIIQTQTRII
jgi:hypothetical protein